MSIKMQYLLLSILAQEMSRKYVVDGEQGYVVPEIASFLLLEENCGERALFAVNYSWIEI